MSAPTVTREVRLAATAVPPGGLITSFLGNQAIYCSLICPYLLQGVVTVPVALLQSPGVFVTGLQSGSVLKAIGAAAASVTGTANAAATPAILKDGTIVAPRALNALEVAVVGVLSIGPAAAGGSARHRHRYRDRPARTPSTRSTGSPSRPASHRPSTRTACCR